MSEPENDRDPEARADAAASSELSSGELWESERIVSDAIGRLMVLWGFKRNMGRVWTLLYLSNEPLTAFVLRERLQLSAGAISMTLNELARWGVVHKVWRQGDRHDYYEAESSLWKMISRVLRERELSEVDHTIEALEDALASLSRRTGADANRSQTQRLRIEQLLELARLGRSMLDALINHARMDASWLPRFRFGRSER
ncbi:MAG TPA: MarR family transcriptional regulator [Polyangiales bacterium]|nr:MarR family transcriptional regulator [Polyangiales bacterium]